MKARLKCLNPGEIEYEMSITMTAAHWDRLRAQLDSAKDSMSYPGADLRRKIDDLLTQARKVYYPAESGADPQQPRQD
jgi:hypothetical protein